MKDRFSIHIKCLVLGIVLTFMPNTDYCINLRGVHLSLGLPLDPGRLSIVSGIQYSTDMLFLRFLANLSPPESFYSISIHMPLLWFFANVGAGYLFFLGLSLLMRLSLKNKSTQPVSNKSVQMGVVIIIIVALFTFFEIWGIHYVVNREPRNIMAYSILSLFMTVYVSAFFFSTNTFLYWKLRLALCVCLHVYLLFFLTFRVLNAISSRPSYMDTVECLGVLMLRFSDAVRLSSLSSRWLFFVFVSVLAFPLIFRFIRCKIKP